MSLSGNTEKINELLSKINALPEAGSGGGSGGGVETCTVTLSLGSGFNSYQSSEAFISVVNEDGTYESITIPAFGISTSVDYPPVTVDNVLVGSLVMSLGVNVTIPDYSIEGDAEFVARHSNDIFVFIVRGNCSISINELD